MNVKPYNRTFCLYFFVVFVSLCVCTNFGLLNEYIIEKFCKMVLFVGVIRYFQFEIVTEKFRSQQYTVECSSCGNRNVGAAVFTAKVCGYRFCSWLCQRQLVKHINYEKKMMWTVKKKKKLGTTTRTIWKEIE